LRKWVSRSRTPTRTGSTFKGKDDMAQAPNTEALDEHLKDVVTAIQSAVNWAMPHLQDPKIVDKAISDCKEILDVVMEGKVSEWLK